MTRDYRFFIDSHHVHMLPTQKKYEKVSKYKMINFDFDTNQNKTKHNPNWP